MKKIVLIVLLLMCVGAAYAQEFRCSVSINYQKLQNTTQQFESSDVKIFESMKQAIEDFINLRRWTNLEFEQNEKIDCSISIVLNQRSTATDFRGQFSIQLRRPVFNSNYTTGLFNYMEGANELDFSYNESQPLEFDPNTFYDNLSSTVAFYVYIMLGMYFDSFAPYGGEPFYQVAQTIQQTAAGHSTEYRGWQSKHGLKARYWFMENATNSQFSQLHQAIYDYHRMGLDMMTKDQRQGRENIIRALEMLAEMHKNNRNDLMVTQFMEVKMSELISIFTPASEDEKHRVYAAVKEVTPLNISKLKDWNVN